MTREITSTKNGEDVIVDTEIIVQLNSENSTVFNADKTLKFEDETLFSLTLL